jgi:hypothetical protein
MTQIGHKSAPLLPDVSETGKLRAFSPLNLLEKRDLISQSPRAESPLKNAGRSCILFFTLIELVRRVIAPQFPAGEEPVTR